MALAKVQQAVVRPRHPSGVPRHAVFLQSDARRGTRVSGVNKPPVSPTRLTNYL